MKIEITGEHKGVTKRIAVWECTKEVVPGEMVDVEEEIMAALRQQMRHYIHAELKNERPDSRT
jgi:hypothetical protein